ncbi:hypothetical protein ACFTAO_09700 [Paenibacillus rhizoplanae]
MIGIRIGELVSINLEDIDLEENTILIFLGKGVRNVFYIFQAQR